MRVLAIAVLAALPVSVAMGQVRMTEEKQRHACEQVAEWVNDGSLRDRALPYVPLTEQERTRAAALNRNLTEQRAAMTFNLENAPRALRIDVDGDGKLETIAQSNGIGSCSGEILYSIDLAEREGAAAFGFAPVPASGRFNERFLELVHWGTSELVLQIDGETYVATTRRYAWNGVLVVLLSWFGEQRYRALCAFGRLPETQIEAAPLSDTGNDNVCRAVSAGTASPLRWQTWMTWDSRRPVARELAIGVQGAHGQHLLTDGFPAKRMSVDIDGDGTMDHLALWSHSSGAGCGSESQYIVPISEDGESLGEARLVDALRGIKGRIDAVPDLADMRVLSFDGRHYLLARYQDTKLGVFSVRESGRPDASAELAQHCAAVQRPQVYVDHYFPLLNSRKP